jgi:hypothetical protein
MIGDTNYQVRARRQRTVCRSTLATEYEAWRPPAPRARVKW